MSDIQATPFATSSEDAIARTIDIESDHSAVRFNSDTPLLDHISEFEDFYEIERTARDIVDGGFKRVALQFPDLLLPDSVPIYRLLKRRVGEAHELYVLADTSYGSCCVDEVAAQHVDADFMVHYGHACMSQTYRLPVLYIFGRRPIDVDDCATQLADTLKSSCSGSDPLESNKKPVILRHDVAYTYQADTIVAKVREQLEALGVSVPVLYQTLPSRFSPPAQKDADVTTSTQLPIKGDLPVTLENGVILYIGGESLGLTNLLMTHASCDIYSYDPSSKTVRQESTRTNRLLMRRYAIVQKARDADVFGILIGTLGVASYLPLISHIRTLLARARKKSYTISVGKLNPAKLANFMEIECFVLVACPENSVIEAKEFYRPIITPYELEVALQAEGTWTGRYVLNFETLLSEHANEDQSFATANEEEDPDRPMFSLVTGKYRHAKRYGGHEETTEGTNEANPTAVILRNQDGTVSRLDDSAAGQFLQSRSYRGLETRTGQDAPSILEQGRSGIARGYSDDHR
ncbi:hypothetical protein SERLA73DRAFT_184369 [Serpula lacrymans var. lacrymans S7.3]|uniref:2-(3-amino-3-carboxypropyl)histidine synthase subunit 2 n=2 Tax=Serpula lacrymans var. lacrymans TaxID=341189 RepID=F8Q342_SERL3|nr:uncharacterized protein SERLADRAFT_472037 [Serpula lacrymans var. lacrymans S7.9]EGN97603.1 hypothetical protein SERLA73DRAFT_184369 [Serpula lacrymans var. lacrymans S7.3]EGO23195.1 hypothetical protein SERLADRAFT_472037 [Serpula lacrymans var. lacrymans S7.9]